MMCSLRSGKGIKTMPDIKRVPHVIDIACVFWPLLVFLCNAFNTFAGVLHVQAQAEQDGVDEEHQRRREAST
jgi:hypothetical protein